MPIDVQDRGDHLEARVSACRTFDEVQVELDQLLEICKEKKPARLLLDLRPATIEIGYLKRYELGIRGARFAPYVGKVCVVGRAELIDPEKLGVQVAQNRGLQVDIFTDPDQALAWLRS